jgi:hypothetical protein
MSVDVTFTDASKPGPSGPITAWDIDFGDGSSHGSGPGPWTHTYAAAGDKTVTLVVTGTGGDGTDTIIKTVQVGAGGGSYASLAAALTYNTRAGAGADEFAALDAAGVIAAGGRHVVCTTRAPAQRGHRRDPSRRLDRLSRDPLHRPGQLPILTFQLGEAHLRLGV